MGERAGSFKNFETYTIYWKKKLRNHASIGFDLKKKAV